ncbi:MAG: TlpA disulfide reductase family protein, partial [Thermoleophilaceae bacterium]
RLALVLASVALLAGCGSGDSTPDSAADPAADMRALAGAPAPLAALHRQANELLPGGKDAYDKRIAQLRGHPIVVNKWGAWCGPCRAEFPYFQRLGVKYGKRIAFVGVDFDDSNAAARKLLKKLPLTYPSYIDADGDIANAINGPQATPVTTFYDAEGGIAYTHQGTYLSQRKLEEDIRRYAR